MREDEVKQTVEVVVKIRTMFSPDNLRSKDVIRWIKRRLKSCKFGEIAVDVTKQQ